MTPVPFPAAARTPTLVLVAHAVPTTDRGAAPAPDDCLAGQGGAQAGNRWNANSISSSSAQAPLAAPGGTADSGGDSIATVEAGGRDHHTLVWTPAGYAALLPARGTQLWLCHGAAARPRRPPRLPAARAWPGGSSSLNGMIYLRGRPGDYDDWAAAGCDGWSGTTCALLPPGRMQCARGRARRPPAARRQRTAASKRPAHAQSLRPAFHRSRAASGLSVQRRLQRRNPARRRLVPVTQHGGERWNAARAYLHGGRGGAACNGGRANLHVLAGLPVLRIAFAGRRAIGVMVRQDGREQLIRARREVIVSAGAFGSPQLLMVSGVGPARHLGEFGIPMVHDLPGVGGNLQDHLGVALHKRVGSPELFGVSLGGVFRLLGEILRYRRDRSGMLSSTMPRPAPSCAAVRGSTSRICNCISSSPWPTTTCRMHLGHGYSCHVCLLRPRSRRVRLASPDMRAAPRIDPGYLSDVRDLDDLVAGVRIVRSIFAMPQLAALGGRNCIPPACAPMAATTMRCAPSSVPAPTPSTIRSAPAAWAWTRGRWSIRNCGCAVCRRCAWSMRRSCRRWSAAAPMPRPS